MIKCKNTIVCESICNECNLQEDDIVKQVAGTKVTVGPRNPGQGGIETTTTVDTSKSPNILTKVSDPNDPTKSKLVLNKDALTKSVSGTPGSSQDPAKKEKPITPGTPVDVMNNEEKSFMDDLYKIIKFSGIK